ADGGGQVAHAQAGVPALLGVGGRPAPVLAEEKRQVALGLGEVVRVEGAQQRVALDAPVEALDQLVEEALAPDRVEQVDDRHRLAVGPALAAHGDEPAAAGPGAPGRSRHAGHEPPPPSSPAGGPSGRNPCPKSPPTGRAWACQWSGMLRMWSST